MKKFSLLLLMLIAGIGSTWAATEVTSSNISTAMVDGAYITLQCMDTNGGDGYYFNGATTKSSTLGYANFYKIVANSDATAFYLQRVSDSKYVANSSNAVAMVDATSDAAAFTFSIATADNWTTTGTAANNGTNTVRFTTSSTYLNCQGAAATPKYATGTGGYSIWQVKTYEESEVTPYQFVGNFSIKSARSSGYATWTGDDSQISQSTSLSLEGVWTITYDGTAYKLGNKGTSNYYATTSSFTSDGAQVYIKENPYNAGYYCVSLTSDLSANCWDDQSGKVGTWQPASDDYEGTSWTLTAVTDAEIEALSVQAFVAPTETDGKELGTVGTTSVTSITSGKYYIIKGYDQGSGVATGYLYDESSTLKAASTCGTTLNYVWYVQSRTSDTYYLYNLGTKQFVNVAGGAVTTTTETGTKFFGGTDGVWAIMSPTSTSCIDFGYWGTSPGTWNESSSSPSGSRRVEIYEAELQTVAAGWDVTLPEDKPYMVIGDKANSITAATAADDNDHWFLMTQTRDGESPMYDNGTSTMKRAASTLTPSSLTGALAADNTKYLVRFVATETDGVYNLQFASGNYVQTTLVTGTYSGRGNYFVYNINSEDGNIGWNLTTDNSTYGSRVDNNGAGNTLAFWSTGQITTSGSNNNWYVYPVSFAAETTINYTLTNALNETYTGSYKAYWNNGSPAAPTFATAAGATISDATYAENAGTYTMTGNITFPFSISNSTTQNAVTIESALGNSKWCNDGSGNAIATNSDNTYIYSSNKDNYSWYIYPTFSEGVFSFKLYNVGAAKWMPTADNVSTSYGTATAMVADEASAGAFPFMTINTGNGFATNTTDNKFLTINTSAASQNIWAWSYSSGSGHKGSNLSFADLTYKSDDDVTTEFNALKNTTKFDLVDDATVVSPTEYAAPSEINTAIDAAQDVDDTDVDEMAEFINSTYGKEIATFNSASASYGAPLTVTYTQSAEYGTMIMPVNFTRPDGFTTYTCASATDGVLDLVENTNGTDKNIPYIVKATTGTYQFIGYSNGAGTENVTSGCLTGVLSSETTYVPANSYILAKYNNVLGFYKVSADNVYTANKYKCYYTPASESARTAFYFPGSDTPTAIESIFGGESTQANGKFIQNGKMVIVNNGIKYNVAGQKVNE